jgi:hypothetical protein
MEVWELNPEGLEPLWLKASATSGGGGGNISAESHHDWGRRAVPSFSSTLEFALQLSKITENLSQCSRGDFFVNEVE